MNKTHTSKVWFNSEADSHSGNYYIIEDTGSDLIWKYAGGTWPSIANIPYHSNISITVYVNATSNKTRSELAWSGGSGSTSEQSYTNNQNDYASFDGGSINGELKIWNWQVNRTGISSSETFNPPNARLNLMYDANGNLVTGDGKYREYNSLNQLWKIYNGSDNTTLLQEYEYRPLEERIKRVRIDDSTVEVRIPADPILRKLQNEAMNADEGAPPGELIKSFRRRYG